MSLGSVMYLLRISVEGGRRLLSFLLSLGN